MDAVQEIGGVTPRFLIVGTGTRAFSKLFEVTTLGVDSNPGEPFPETGHIGGVVGMRVESGVTPIFSRVGSNTEMAPASSTIATLCVKSDP